jgi:hypothetical protein
MNRMGYIITDASDSMRKNDPERVTNATQYASWEFGIVSNMQAKGGNKNENRDTK